MTPDWKPWRDHFEGQQHRPMPALVSPYGLPDSWKAALIYSLARFQLGESGEGRIAQEIDHLENSVVDADYRAALKLFVREEGRHARVLAAMVHELGGSLLKQHWSNRLFTRGRRLLGVHFKLLVLLVAEVIGLGFYTLVKDRLPSGTFRAALKEIIDDESFHLFFHTEYFRRLLQSPWRRPLFLAVWWSVSLAACAVVYIDHRRTWRVFRVSFFPAARRLVSLIDETSMAIVKPNALMPLSVHAWIE